MKSGVYLVAKREFLQILKMKSFWLTLLILPVALALGPLLSDTLNPSESTRVAIVDRSGGEAGEALRTRYEFDESQYLLRQFSRYVQRYDLQSADPDALWSQYDRWYTPADIAAFEAEGGIEEALRKIEAVRPEGVPEFSVPVRDRVVIDPPASLLDAEGEEFAQAARALFDNDAQDTNPEIIILIPENYPADTQIGLFAADQPYASFVLMTEEVLTTDLRMRLLADAGISPDRAIAVQTAAPSIAVDIPPPGGGAREVLIVQSIVPIALAYILMMSLMLSGSWMLQGSVEERSNKLLESLLACISPEDLMYGKLLGGLSVGLLMIFVWAACAGIAGYATQGAIADTIRPALEPVSSPGVIAAILFFFIAGYIGISAIFVAIGGMVESMNEAQGYLMPVLFLILLPITFLLQAILAGNDGIMVKVLTWVPLWTPFAVLARLGLGIETWELIGAGIVLSLAIVFELRMITKLFRASLLATGQKPSLAKMWARMRGASEGA